MWRYCRTFRPTGTVEFPFPISTCFHAIRVYVRFFAFLNIKYSSCIYRNGFHHCLAAGYITESLPAKQKKTLISDKKKWGYINTKKCGGSRRNSINSPYAIRRLRLSLFEEKEKFALSPLSSMLYEIKTQSKRSRRRVQIIKYWLKACFSSAIWIVFQLILAYLNRIVT